MKHGFIIYPAAEINVRQMIERRLIALQRVFGVAQHDHQRIKWVSDTAFAPIDEGVFVSLNHRVTRMEIVMMKRLGDVVCPQPLAKRSQGGQILMELRNLTL